jgi:hypothetical protein
VGNDLYKETWLTIEGVNVALDTNIYLRACARTNLPYPRASSIDNEIDVENGIRLKEKKAPISPREYEDRINQLIAEKRLIVTYANTYELEKHVGSKKLNESNKIRLKRLLELLKPIKVTDHYTEQDWKTQREVFGRLKKSVENIISESQRLCPNKPAILKRNPLPPLEAISKTELQEIFEAMQNPNHIFPNWHTKRKEFIAWHKNRDNALRVLEAGSKFRPNDMQIIVVADRHNALLESVDDDISIFKKYYNEVSFLEKNKKRNREKEGVEVSEMEAAIAEL